MAMIMLGVMGSRVRFIGRLLASVSCLLAEVLVIDNPGWPSEFFAQTGYYSRIHEGVWALSGYSWSPAPPSS